MCIWAMVDTEEPEEERKVFVFGTGWDVTEFIDLVGSMDYIDTVKSNFYMWHLFIDSKDDDFDIAEIMETLESEEETNDGDNEQFN
jgi:hypothetical protein